jgi:hypothetical protein
MTALTGPDLLAFVEGATASTKSEVVRGAGYVTTTKDGEERVNFSAFYDAMLEAKGISMSFGKGSSGEGRKLSNITTVQGNANIIVGKAYTTRAGIEPGNKYEIEIDNDKVITLTPVEA